MSEAIVRYNLIDEPWIRVRTLAGDTLVLSIGQLFDQADGIRCLANDLPTQDLAILRLLLAILHRSIEDLEEEFDFPSDAWGSLWEARQLPLGLIRAYLENWYERFDLFDPDVPFMQVEGLHTANGAITEIKKIIADVPDGDPLFSQRAGRSLESMDFAEAARWLVHVQAFDTSGIKSGVVGDPTAKKGKSYPIGTGWTGRLGGVYLEGSNLTETLILNLVLFGSRESADEYGDSGAPAWERPPRMPGDSSHLPEGKADLYTWQARMVRLCADGSRVTGLVLTNGDRLEPYNLQQHEPMTSWRRSKNLEKRLGISPVYYPSSIAGGRALWRGLPSLLPEQELEANGDRLAPGVIEWASFLTSDNGGRQLQRDIPLRVHATAVEYGVQSASYANLTDDYLDMSAFLLSPSGELAAHLAKECMADTDNAVSLLGLLARRIALAAGGSGQADGVESSAKVEAYYELDGAFRRWLAKIGPHSDLAQMRNEWHRVASRLLSALARKMVSEASPEAVVGRMVEVRRQVSQWLCAGDAEARFYHKLAEALPIEEVEEPLGKED